MRDESFMLDAEAAGTARPPYRYLFLDVPWPQASWSIRDGGNRQVGRAKTRAGARSAVRALYGAAA
jgi:hypothetical protein